MITIATFADPSAVCDNREMDADNYLELIRDAKVYDVAIESPLEVADILSARLNNRILMKREDLQPVFSFKLRGAYNKIAGLSDAELANGVICSSAGNHAQGVALAASKRGVRAMVVMPVTTPAIKVDAVRALGGEVILSGDAYDDAYAHARELEVEQALTFIHPFDDSAVIAGQGTIGVEILKQAGSDIDAVFVPIGGGGLIAGIAACIKLQHPDIRIIGVEPDDSAAMRDSLAAGAPVSLNHVGIFADGVAVRRVGDETFRLCQQFVDAFFVHFPGSFRFGFFLRGLFAVGTFGLGGGRRYGKGSAALAGTAGGGLITVDTDRRATQNAARPAVGIGNRSRREIVGETHLLLFRRRVEQPQQQKEGHHGGHEVGVGPFPGAAMVCVATLLDLLYDDRLVDVRVRHGNTFTRHRR